MELAIGTEQTPNLFSQFSKLNIEKIPNYIQIRTRRSLGNLTEADDAIEQIYELRETLIENLTCGTALSYQASNYGVRFRQLSTEVSIDCKLISSDFQVLMHKSYQEIIGMGEKIIPLLIDRLDVNPNLWFMALESITGQNPVPIADRGKVKKEVSHWKSWAVLNNYA